MLYPFITLDDNTEIVHYEVHFQDGKETVKVCIEKPIYGGFQSAVYYLPDYRWERIIGFSQEDLNYFADLLHSLAHTIIELARKEKSAVPAPFFLESNMVYVKKSVQEPCAGKGTIHELIEIADDT